MASRDDIQAIIAQSLASGAISMEEPDHLGVFFNTEGLPTPHNATELASILSEKTVDEAVDFIRLMPLNQQVAFVEGYLQDYPALAAAYQNNLMVDFIGPVLAGFEPPMDIADYTGMESINAHIATHYSDQDRDVVLQDVINGTLNSLPVGVEPEDFFNPNINVATLTAISASASAAGEIAANGPAVDEPGVTEPEAETEPGANAVDEEEIDVFGLYGIIKRGSAGEELSDREQAIFDQFAGDDGQFDLGSDLGNIISYVLENPDMLRGLFGGMSSDIAVNAHTNDQATATANNTVSNEPVTSAAPFLA